MSDRFRLNAYGLLLDARHGDGEFRNRVEMPVFGLKRSGNHVIINWIFLNLPGTVCFLNNVRVELHRNPYLSFGQSFVKTGADAVNYPRSMRSRRIRTRRWHRGHPIKDCLIHSYEDRLLERLHADAPAGRHDRYVGRSDVVRPILILRDPFNTMASRMKRHGMFTDTTVELWKSYAREFVGDTRHLGPHCVPISYNRWCVDAGYRRDLGDMLQLADPDQGVDEVPTIGGGSSFDATSFHGRGSVMRTSERWREFAEVPAYQRIFRDPELLELSHRIFGDIPGTESLVSQGST
ncbi:MAG TPA: hypothetical protein VK928_07050 [Longimicrobiales bacterium]|nr:hypothetical protein [Longimicrobiales bacterium]